MCDLHDDIMNVAHIVADEEGREAIERCRPGFHIQGGPVPIYDPGTCPCEDSRVGSVYAAAGMPWKTVTLLGFLTEAS